MFQAKVVEKTKTHILYVIIFFRKSYRLWQNCRAWQVTDDCVTSALHAEYLRLQIHT